jgi:hypothetical protein
VKLTKTDRVRLVGNSVAPPIAAALVRSNLVIETDGSKTAKASY